MNKELYQRNFACVLYWLRQQNVNFVDSIIFEGAWQLTLRGEPFATYEWHTLINRDGKLSIPIFSFLGKNGQYYNKIQMRFWISEFVNLQIEKDKSNVRAFVESVESRPVAQR